MTPNARARQQLLTVLYAAREAKPDNGWVAVKDLKDAVGDGVDFGLAVLVELGQAKKDGYRYRIAGAGVLACEAAGAA